MSSIQRSLNTLQYYTGTQNGVLITEVSAIQRFGIERFHCIFDISYFGTAGHVSPFRIMTIKINGICSHKGHTGSAML